MSRDCVLLGDIGGTNARFAVACGREIANTASFGVAAHATPLDAIAGFLKDLPPERRPRAAALACAGPVQDAVAAVTNSPWRIDARRIEREFGFGRVLLVNDFEALAWGVPRFEASMLRSLGGGRAQAGRPAVVLGPGTGLGIAAYLPPPQGPAAIVGEGGHATLPAADDKEAAILARLRADSGHVSAEHVISGGGLVRLYETLAALDGETPPRRGAAEITQAAIAGQCAASRAALDMFCAMLGTLAGDLALTLGAQGGVFIAGGIAPRIADYLATSGFRRRFEEKGRFRDYLAAIPASIVMHPEPAFLGLVQLLDARA